MKKGILRTILSEIWQYGSHLYDRFCFQGCDFAAWVDQKEAGFSQEQGNFYQPSNGKLKRILSRQNILPTDRILDIGCGKGRAMAIMASFPFREVMGIDLSDMLVNIANKNFSTLNLSNCLAITANAADYTNYDRFTYIYLFNSLPAPVFRVAMRHICDSLSRAPRHCTLIYLNPVCHNDLIANTPFRHVKTYHSWSTWFEYRIYEADTAEK